MATQERITVHNLADLKNTSDDAIPNYLNSLKFTQDHSLVDTRLALGYGAFVIAAACFLWDYKFGFDDTKWYTAAAVATYTLINGALTIWTTFIEKGTVYQGTSSDGTKISISTSTKKNEPTYHVVVDVTPKNAPNKPQRLAFSRSFTEWFDAQGHFVALPFQTMLASTVPVVAQADPKRAAPSSDFLNYDAQTLDALAAAESTGAEAAKKAKKRKV
ncbi:microsomal signal peptidase 25 kDa subunit-domain-containing protein [Astrocystis sublimbata]|nr:microsomal signal peptidase 25 kDa subunit-domain-containing protein [Astrocystis sublimbata]